MIENILEEIAITLRTDALEIRTINAYGVDERNVTPYGHVLETNPLPRILEQLTATAQYTRRQQGVARFNAESRSYLRGIALTPVKFGISFTTRFLNQANGLVNVYTDGTVQVSTGATEMGQGVHTKIRQLVADQFGLNVDRVSIGLTSTEKNNNTSPTAASASTDLNGQAAVQACDQIRGRLAKLAANMLSAKRGSPPEDPALIRFAAGMVYDARRPEVGVAFGALTQQARRERIDLGARGFYRTPDLDFDAVDVLREAGYTDAEIQGFRASGAV